jgi:hypothetical protein
VPVRITVHNSTCIFGRQSLRYTSHRAAVANSSRATEYTAHATWALVRTEQNIPTNRESITCGAVKISLRSTADTCHTRWWSSRATICECTLVILAIQ